MLQRLEFSPLAFGPTSSLSVQLHLIKLATEPLACAIRSDTNIKFSSAEHKVQLYADDHLLFIKEPLTSFPPQLECLTGCCHLMSPTSPQPKDDFSIDLSIWESGSGNNLIIHRKLH